MPATYEIRADYDAETIVIYQAYSPHIAIPAIKAKRFVSPFSFNRMTWIKPSFLWMMERSNWGHKASQEYTLAIRITRTGWEEALSHGVLTHSVNAIYGNADEWRKQAAQAQVNIQWDPERSIRGGKLEHRSIQVGLSRHIIERYVDEWIVDIQDLSPIVKKMYDLLKAGEVDKAKKFLPKERVYPVSEEIGKRIGISKS